MFKNIGNSWGWGDPHRPSGTEIPGGRGVQNKKPSVGGMDIFWNYTFHNSAGDITFSVAVNVNEGLAVNAVFR